MSSKPINLNIKLNFFKKLFLLNIGVVFLTIFISFLFNFSFLNKYSIHRRETQILKIKPVLINMIESYKDESDYKKITDYVDYVDYAYGIKIDLFKLPKNFNKNKNNHRHQMIRNQLAKFSSLKNGEGIFDIKDNSNKNTPLIIMRYYLKVNEDVLLIFKTSLTALSRHNNDLYVFNCFIGIISVLVSSVFAFIFSKKVTKNIDSLKNSAESISNLIHPDNIIINSGDELEELSYSLDKMSTNLQVSINSLKSFVSNASHELKTPISVLCLYSQALVQNSVDESRKKEYYKVLLEKSLDMKELVQSLLTLSKISSLDYKLNSEEFDIKDLVQSSIELYDYFEFEKDLEIELNLNSTFFSGDKNLLKICINNLIQNMYKYSEEESLASISLDDRQLIIKNKINHVIKIDKENLFEPFTRGENALEGKIDGSGLGLSLTKRILELNNLKYKIDIREEYFIFYIYF